MYRLNLLVLIFAGLFEISNAKTIFRTGDLRLADLPLIDEKLIKTQKVPLVEPPPLPTASQMTERRMLDSPVLTKSDVKADVKEAIQEVVAEKSVVPTLPTADLIKTCTPDCTLVHCTEACKCANTHAAVRAKCNPPPNAPITVLCQEWYDKCPMFKPVSYDGAQPKV